MWFVSQLLEMVTSFTNASARHRVRRLQNAVSREQARKAIRGIAEYLATDRKTLQLCLSLHIECRKAIVHEGGIDGILEAMARYAYDWELQVEGCRALANLSHEEFHPRESQSSNVRRYLIARRGGVEIIFRAIQIGCLPPSIPTAAIFWDLCEQALRALWELSFHPRVKAMILQKNGIALVERLASKMKRWDVDGVSGFHAKLWKDLTLENLAAAKSESQTVCPWNAIFVFGVGLLSVCLY